MFMASKKKQKAMVFHEEETAALLAVPAADHSPSHLNVLNPSKTGEGRMEQCSITEDAGMEKSRRYFTKANAKKPCVLPAKQSTRTDPPSENLSPDGFCKGIKVTLDNNNMWNEFFRCRTEMILTKQGSRMFPYCRFRMSGLDSGKKYCLVMDIQPLDNNRYKWTGQTWQVAGKADSHVKDQVFLHPESPSTGEHWMQNPVSFYKLRVTMNTLDQQGNIILCPMHRYLPRLHVVQSDKAPPDLKLNGPTVASFTFPQTEFMAVPAYQNSQFAQLKVDYNPFSKGLKEDRSSSLALKLKSITGKDQCKDGHVTLNEQLPVSKNLKSLLANHKPRNSKLVDQKMTTPGDSQNASTADANHSSPKSTCESHGNCQASQKLFSELIREAHVSLMRCNLEQVTVDNGTGDRSDGTDEKVASFASKGQDVADNLSENVQGKISSVEIQHKNEHSQISETLEDTDNTEFPSFTDKSSTAAVKSTSDSPKTSAQFIPVKSPSQSELNVKQQKKTATLPLPALARFLKQHSLKSKKIQTTTPKSPEIQEKESTRHSDHSNQADHPAKDSNSEAGQCEQNSDCVDSSLNLSRDVLSTFLRTQVTGKDAISNAKDNGPQPDECLSSSAASEHCDIDSLPPHIELMLSKSDKPVFSLVTTSISSPCPTLCTSSILSQSDNVVLPTQHNPSNSSAPQSDLSTMKSTSLLLDCPQLNFDSLSPACSDPLPPLPGSLAFEFDSSPSSSSAKVVGQDSQQSSNSTASVFTWHTVLPPSDSYLGSSFTSLQVPQTLPLGPIMPSLIPSQASLPSDPQPLSTSTASPPPHPSPSFQVNEQSLPFPAELSPLTLQLPLSPTFSSLDADGLSPTPSIADLVHFISTDDDLGMEFSNTETAAPPPCSLSSVVAEVAHSPPPQEQPPPVSKIQKSRRKKQDSLVKADSTEKTDNSTYTSKKPSLEEVEEQLFVSFTSKEALRLHIGDTSESPNPDAPPPRLEDDQQQQQQTTDNMENVKAAEDAGSQDEQISDFQRILLRDLKLMKHRQVIHPVLQEVGLKMSLLDPTLAIDLQYLGVQLPIPPPGMSLEPLAQTLEPPQSVSAPFMSRTGKTTDVTQIKGWRDKFVPSETLPTQPKAEELNVQVRTQEKKCTEDCALPEVAAVTDAPKKNLSAFCSDMLDEYLENEGKLIDERAASFSQPVAEAITYKLPTSSTSYVRTLDSVLKKATLSPPTSDLISSFVPPSKRPRLTSSDLKMLRKGERKQKIAGPKQKKPGPEAAVVELHTEPKVPAMPLSEEKTTPLSEAPQITQSKSKNSSQLSEQSNDNDHTEPVSHTSSKPGFKRKHKINAKLWPLSANASKAHQPEVSDDMAPLESDSELGDDSIHGSDTIKKLGRPLLTRALIKQKDLENSVAWGGQPKTKITEERATIALTSLFTLMGFVCENPTAPIQLMQRQAPPCLNEFCRLGCVCSSLTYSPRITHCGQPQCMFGCSCLKQKVVLLRNLEGSDSSPSYQNSTNMKPSRKRRKRMKMAYILKEAESVSQPAERIRILWKKGCPDPDLDVIYIPEPASLTPHTEEISGDDGSCARVRSYTRQNLRKLKENVKVEQKVSKRAFDKHSKKRHTSFLISPVKAGPQQPGLSDQQEKPHDQTQVPSKRLVIIAECQWKNEADRNHILKVVCETMAQDRLHVREPFWVKSYLINPLSKLVEEEGTSSCIHYKVHISQPNLQRRPSTPQHSERKLKQQSKQQETSKQKQGMLQQEALQQKAVDDTQPLEDSQQQVTDALEDCQQGEKEVDYLEHCQQDMMDSLEDWQQEVEDDDDAGDDEPLKDREDAGLSSGREDDERTAERKKSEKRQMMGMALPFLTGISPAGFLVANRKQSGGTDNVVEVNGKPYPLAKVQLGRMGALHPANRLAAYLTGRVGTKKKTHTIASSSSLPTPSQAVSLTALSAGIQTMSGPVSSSEPLKVLKIPNPAVGCGASSSSQIMMVPVPTPTASVQMPRQPPQALIPCATNQRMVLQPLPSMSGIRFFRKPDGKIVQLVPLNQMRPVTTGVVIQRGPASTPQLPMKSQSPVNSKSNEPAPPKPSTSAVATIPTPDLYVASVLHAGSSASDQINPMTNTTANSSPTTTVLPITSVKDLVVPKSNQEGMLTAAASIITKTTNTLHNVTPLQLGNVPIGNLANSKIAETTSAISTTPHISTRSLQSPVITINNQPTLLTNVLSPMATANTLSSVSELHKSGKTTDVAPNCQTNKSSVITYPKTPSSQSKSLTEAGTSLDKGTEHSVKTVSSSTGLVDVEKDLFRQIKQETAQEVLLTDPDITGKNAVRPTISVPDQPLTAVSTSEAKHGAQMTDLSPHQTSIDQMDSPSSELATDLVDLDIICIDDEMGLLSNEAFDGAEANSTNLQSDQIQKTDLKVELLSSETENSSDVLEESENDRENRSRLVHSALERRRRSELSRLFNTLRKEVRLSKERATKVSTLTKAINVIQELKVSQKHLTLRKMKLQETRAELIKKIAERTGETEETVLGKMENMSDSLQETLQKQEGEAGDDVIEVVDLLDETDEQTEHSSDDEGYWKKTEVEPLIDIETLEKGPKRKVKSEDDTTAEPLGLSEIRRHFQNSLPTLQVFDNVQPPHRRKSKLEKGVQRRVASISKPSVQSGKKEQTQKRRKKQSSKQPAGRTKTVSVKLESDLKPPSEESHRDSALSSSSDSVAPLSAVTQPTMPDIPASQHVQTGPQVSKHLPKSPTTSSPTTSHRPRTVPNILSRSKKRVPSLSCTNPAEGSLIQALVPAEVLSLVGTLLPTTTSGVASVTLNVPSISNQNAPVSSITHQLPVGNVIGLSQCTDGSSSGLGAGPLHPQTSVQSKDQGRPQLLRVLPVSGLMPPPQHHSSEGPFKLGVKTPEVESKSNMENSAQSENLTSLLNEIVFLNQQTCPTADIQLAASPTIVSRLPQETGEQDNKSTDCSVGTGAEQQEHGRVPCVLELDEGSSENDESAAEKQGADPCHHIKDELGSSSSSSGQDQLQRAGRGAKAPPPLLHMKLGGTKIVESSMDRGEGYGNREGDEKDSDVAWRPMPRLVPLGLKGNPSN